LTTKDILRLEGEDLSEENEEDDDEFDAEDEQSEE
jgi:hypothetical protein